MEQAMSAPGATLLAPDTLTVLIIEDEEGIVELVRMYLEEAGFRVLAAQDGPAGLELHLRERPELVILDVQLPGMDGWEVCARIRRKTTTPILMLTVRSFESDRVRGLEGGADDYLTKPFSPRELVSRVRAILRRTTVPRAAPPNRLSFPGLTILPAARRVEVDGQPVELTAREFDLLLILASVPGYAFTREELFRRVLGYEYFGNSRAIDVYIATLRKKIERDPATPRYIKTRWTIGYAFDPDGSEPR
jgi:two-component system, OmpR family, response regulator ResD